MRIGTIWPIAIAVAATVSFSVYAAEPPQAVNGGAEASAETKARADFEAAAKAAQEADAAVVPLRAAMQKADADYAAASKTATAKRQHATDTKNLAGESGAKDLKQAEADVPAAIKTLADAIAAKPLADKALVEAKEAALPLQQAFDAAENIAKEAETAAKIAAAAATKLEDEARSSTSQAAAKRRFAEVSKHAIGQAQKNEQQATALATTAAQEAAVAEKQKQAVDDALAAAKNRVAAATTAYQAAQKAATEAEAAAKKAPEAEKQKAVADVAAKRKAVDAAKNALTQAQAAQQSAQGPINAAAQKLARATAQQKAAETTVANVKKQLAAAIATAAAAEQAVPVAVKLADEQNRVAAEAAAKRKVVADAAAVLAKIQQVEQQAQTQVNAAAQKLAEAQTKKRPLDAALANVKNQVTAATAAAQAAEQAAQAAEAKAKQVAADAAKPAAEKKQTADDAAAKRKAAGTAKAALTKAQQSEQAAQAQLAPVAQKVAEAEAQKKAADAALATARTPLPAAAAALEAARNGAKELVALDDAAKQAAVDAATKRQAANVARTALNPVRLKFERAALQANTAVQEIERAEARKKSTEEALANLKQRIAAAVQSHVADEQAAKEAEAAAVPLKAEADKTRAAYAAAMKVAEDNRGAAERTKAVLYRLVAAREVASLMESPEPAKPTSRIDELVFAKLATLGLKPVLCSDAVFVRRAYLDVTGTLPTADEAKAFIQETNKNKRVALIDRLLDQQAHFDYWAMKWADILRIKAEFPVKVWPNAAQAYHRWVWESVAQNKPYDKFARELLTSSGSNFRVGPVNFYRAIQDRTPEGIAAVVGLAMMGTRVQLWPEERRAGMAAFFSQVGYKPTSEWKEEIVFWDPLHSIAVPGSTAEGVDAVAKAVAATNKIPQALEQPLSENGPLTAVFPDGSKIVIPPNRDPREVFADWLIRPENPWFAKAAVNRTWAWVMGRGIIQEPDDIRENNPPSNPELLSYLEKEFVASGYNLKHLRRMIFASTTYQLSPIPRSERPEARANFASYELRRVEAEVLNDAVNEVTGSTDLYTSAVPEPFTYIPKDMNAVEVADGSITSSFLTLFGRSARATGMENERVNELASRQWLYTLNSAAMQSKLQSGPKLAALFSSGGKPEEVAERLYLTILSRLPTEADLKVIEAYSKAGVTRGRDMWIDLAWALITSPEFLLRH